MPEFKDFLAALIVLISSFGGAWLAFRLEYKRREDEEELQRCGSANRALYTLYNFWNILEQHRREVIEPNRGKPDAWFKMAATPPTKTGMATFDAGGLLFLLQTENHIVYAALFLEEQRFATAVSLIELRSSIVLNEVFPRLAGAGVTVGSSLVGIDIEQTLGIDTIHKLRVVTAAIVVNVDATLKSIVSAHAQLRAAMKRLYPQRKFVKIEFGMASNQ